MTDPGFGAHETSSVYSNTISCPIPAGAAVGSRILVILTSQGSPTPSAGPADCELLETFTPSATLGQGWIWTAEVGATGNLDPGDALTVTMTGNAPLSMVIYATGGPADVVDSQVSATITMPSSPPFNSSSPGGAALSDARAVHIYGLCAHVSGESPTWAADAATVERAQVTTPGPSRHSTVLVADEGVSSGPVAGRTATASVRCQTAAATVILAPAVPRPAADAGPDQNVAAESVVNLDGTASGGAGAPYTYQWTQTSGPAVTLNDSTAENPSFTAPSSTSTLVFQLVVTDSAGVPSTPDTVTISVHGPEDAVVPVGNVAVAGWTVVPSGQVFQVLADNTDNTYVSSSEDPVNLNLRVDLGPLNTPAPTDVVTLSARVRRENASSGSATLQLIEGASTVIASTTQTIPAGSGFEFVTLTLSSSEIESVTPSAWAGDFITSDLDANLIVTAAA